MRKENFQIPVAGKPVLKATVASFWLDVTKRKRELTSRLAPHNTLSAAKPLDYVDNPILYCSDICGSRSIFDDIIYAKFQSTIL
jgi:hypothetical protein